MNGKPYTKSEFSLFLAAQERLHEVIWESLPEYGRRSGVEVKYLDSITDVDEDTITIDGDEYWRYGGHEHHTVTMPSAFLFSQEAREAVAEKHRQELAEEERKKQEQEALAEKNRRKEYERLKEEFGE